MRSPSHPSPVSPSNQQSHLVKVVALQVRSPALNLIPHALHVMQVVGLVTVLGKHCGCLLRLLDLPCPELPLGSLTVQEPAHHQHKLGHQLAGSVLCCACAGQ